MRRADERTTVEVGQGRADFQPRKPLAQPFQHFFVTGSIDQHAAACGARLSCVLHHSVDQSGQRDIEIGVVEYDLRRLASELERHRAMTLGGFLRHPRSRDG